MAGSSHLLWIHLLLSSVFLLCETSSVTVSDLKKQVEEHGRDQAEIIFLQNKLSEMETQCSSTAEKVDDLQKKLDAKMKELLAKSDSVTSLALQVSILSTQLETLKKQLKNTEAEAKMKELQKIIEEKNIELANKTEELKSRSAQPLRFLQIISMQTEIEKLVNEGENETNYEKIAVLQNNVNRLIEGIQNENNENTKLMFKILAQQDEIANLKKQRNKQTQAQLDKIKKLEDELEDTRNQIKEKTEGLDTSDMRIANLSVEIMELHKKIKPLETEISQVKKTYTEKNAELQKKLDFKERQLKDSQQILNDENEKNYDLIMEVTDLRKQLNQVQTSKAADGNIKELKQQLKTEQKKNKQLEGANRDLDHEVKQLKMCCNDNNNQCDDLQKQLEQSQADTERLLQQVNEKDADINRLQGELQEVISANNNLQDQYQLLEDDKKKLEETIQGLHEQLNEVEEKTIHTEMFTFDASTAHPRIVLSEDNTEASVGQEQQDVADHPGRFDVALAVLGKTGFISGRRYWEVSVAGSLCYNIGMVSESANRKGTFVIQPVRGFWTLTRTKQGQYRAMDRPAVTVPLQAQPLTLGVLLDYKKGAISFYDAGRRTHIYTFRGQKFTDKIYPFVNGCVEEVENRAPIRLLPPGPVDWIQ